MLNKIVLLGMIAATMFLSLFQLSLPTLFIVRFCRLLLDCINRNVAYYILFYEGMRVSAKWRTSMVVGIITFIAAVHYMYMRLGLLRESHQLYMLY